MKKRGIRARAGSSGGCNGSCAGVGCSRDVKEGRMKKEEGERRGFKYSLLAGPKPLFASTIGVNLLFAATIEVNLSSGWDNRPITL